MPFNRPSFLVSVATNVYKVEAIQAVSAPPTNTSLDNFLPRCDCERCRGCACWRACRPDLRGDEKRGDQRGPAGTPRGKFYSLTSPIAHLPLWVSSSPGEVADEGRRGRARRWCIFMSRLAGCSCNLPALGPCTHSTPRASPHNTTRRTRASSLAGGESGQRAHLLSAVNALSFFKVAFSTF